MRNISFLAFILLLFPTLTPAQIIPGNTGYAIPEEKDEEYIFTPKGLENWTDTKQKIQYYFYLRNSGTLELAFKLKSATAGNKINVSLAGKDFSISIPKSNNFQLIKSGRINILNPGFYSLTLQAVRKMGNTIADIQSIALSGTSTNNMHFNSNPRRNAASVHLRFPLPDSSKAIQFYNEITVPEGADPIHTYYMACGFKRGYFGMQVNSPTERRIIFSVWDAGSEAIDRNKVSIENKVQLLAKGDEVFADGFGNEGTGGHSHWIYNWKTGSTYRFLVTALPDSASQTTIYTGYFFIPENQQWKLIASFKAPKDGHYLNNLYSFSENFSGINGQLFRKAVFSNQWIQNSNAKWKELLTSTFTYDATGKAGDRIDYGAGVENGSFYLWNGGFKEANAKYGDAFTRVPTKQTPAIDLYKNADSIAQAEVDRRIIVDAIASGKYDTSGFKNGIYYKILKEGTGPIVQVSDTVVANYKGYLLNGDIFDQSKGTPATFPLNRLIKGWQAGLPLCRVGGSIRLIIPSALAYSIRARSPKIPPNSVLVFDIEVLSRLAR